MKPQHWLKYTFKVPSFKYQNVQWSMWLLVLHHFNSCN